MYLKTGELFAGAGGLGLGFVLAQHHSVRFAPQFAIDNDQLSTSSYIRNLTWLADRVPDLGLSYPKAFVHDVEQLDFSSLMQPFNLSLGELDLLIGGPPCQGFSTSNRKAKAHQKQERNRLVKVFLDKVAELRPRMFLMENVQGLRWTGLTEDMTQPCCKDSCNSDTKSISVLDYVLSASSSMGYHIWHDVLDAADYGVPQHRQRFVLFGIRNDIARQTEDVDLRRYLDAQKAPAPVTVEEAIGDLPPLQNGEAWQGGTYYPRMDSGYVAKMRKYLSTNDLYDHVATKHNQNVIERYRRIPQGGNWENIRDLMGNYAHVNNTHSNIYRRLVADKPAHTISHYRKSMIIHPYQNRGLSMREACRLQSFPDWFRFQGPIDEQQQQLANAVPPLMAAAIAEAVAACWMNLVSGQLRHSSLPRLSSQLATR